ncbi:ATPase family AAA domain-containing protein 2-like [Pectinophora gossypiella]|uniref:ATPase family AAA domain-containing protein 2-like n=1 Tax=Pectinophora gossypiella TaxID=13191 RepID=UPI00214E576B|nr:ATPase family AAA domain-containing protein 2-like [Pectinophora gossypiella]
MNNFGPSDIQPIKIDSNVRFSSIGGLKEHIRCLREMIIFPLMYPELFKKFNTRPAKGVLFHGPPGTGKTLLARALANECSVVGGRKVSFFMRKGADIMNKYYGESERNLRMLFTQARKMKPSIIFFDEIDALAPARRPSDDHTHSSVVATLLAEMDGLCDRGNVIVIGATNRPDAMDPAVRRAGRFDRELYFPPPEADARRDILAIYTKEWEPSLTNDTLDNIAKVTVGYLGSDIKALCSEAVLKAVRRVYPQIYEADYKLVVNATNVEVTTEDILAAMEEIVPAGNRYVPQAARPLPQHCVPLLQGQIQAAVTLLRRTFPVPAERQKQKTQPKLSTSAPCVFLISGECAETYIAPALLAQLEHCIVKELSIPSLHSAHSYSPEQAVITLFAECRRTGRACVIFVRDLLAIWETLVKKNGAAVLLQLWRMRSVGDNTLLLATCSGSYGELPKELQEVFPVYKDCIYCVREPTLTEVNNFLAPVVTQLPLVPPVVFNVIPPPPLPRDDDMVSIHEDC